MRHLHTVYSTVIACLLALSSATAFAQADAKDASTGMDMMVSMIHLMMDRLPSAPAK